MATAASDEAEFDFRRYWWILSRRGWVVMLATAVVVITTAAVSFAQTPVYTAEAEVLVLPTTSTSTIFNQGVVQQQVPAVQLVQTQLQVVTSRPVQDLVRKLLGAAPSVAVSEVGQTNVLRVRASSTIASQAALVANAYASSYVSFEQTQAVDNLLAAGAQIQSKIDDLQKQIVASALPSQRDNLVSQQGVFRQQLAELQVNASLATGQAQLLSPAVTPSVPTSPQRARNVVFAVVVGLVFGVCSAFVLDFLDDSVRNTQELAVATPGLPPLGVIPKLPTWKPSDQPVVASMEDPRSAAAEAYRTLRTNVQFAKLDNAMRVVQVTSPGADEGKTTTISNLAVAFANAGERVCICCCDLRRPRVHQFFALSNSVGFSSVILGTNGLSAAIKKVPGVENLSILPSGPLPPNPAELLASDRAHEVIRSLAAQFDLVLLDCPPVVPVTDAAVISANTDATILVISAEQSTRREVHRALDLLRQVKAPVIGTVLNGVVAGEGYGYYYREYSGYTSHEPDPEPEDKGDLVGHESRSS